MGASFTLNCIDAENDKRGGFPRNPLQAHLLEIRHLHSRLIGPCDLALAAGECLAISGPSGAGKSLLLRMIADLDAGEGEVRLFGMPRDSWSGPQWRRQVVYCAAEPGWWAPLINEHFLPEEWARVRELMGRLGLAAGLFEWPVQRLSTGERLRFALIRALLLNSPVLLLDEPTGALDSVSTGLVEQELKARLQQGLALVLVTHDPSLAQRLAHRHLQLRAGKLEAL